MKRTLLFLILLTSQISFGSITTALMSGNWSEASVWDNGIPGCFDTILIPATIQVDITSTVDIEACPDSILVIVYGRIEFQNGKKLKLPCLSDVLVYAGGSVGVGSGGGNSTYIETCGTQYWNASSGDLNGPTSLCDGPCPPNPGALPIQLLYFDATLNKQSRMVDLSWTTANESDNDYFTIERSSNGLSWQPLFNVDGAGNSFHTIDYFAQDKTPLMGNSYYRLKQTDFNGDFSYSPIVSLYRENQNDILLYPNPVIEGSQLSVDFSQLVITFPELVERALVVEVYSLDGRLIYSKDVDLSVSKQLIIPIGANFSKGVYTVHTALSKSKFVVQ